MPSSERVKLNELVGNQQLVQALWNAVNTSSGSLVNVPPLVKRLLVTGAWKEREVQQLGEIVRFDSFAAFIQAPPLRGCGWPLEKVEALIKDDAETLRLWRQATTRRKGRPPKNKDGVLIKAQQGNSAAYLLTELKERAPALYERVVAGKLAALTAAKQAGIRHERTPLELLRKAWAKASSAERETFRSEIEQ